MENTMDGNLIVAVSGSKREDSSTSIVLNEIGEGVSDMNGRFEMIDMSEYDVPPLDLSQDEPPEDSVHITSRIQESDGIVLGTPVYHGSYSGELKCVLDHCGFDEFQNKTVGLCAVSGGSFPTSALDHMRTVCRSLNSWVLPSEIAVPNTSDNIDNSEGRILDEDMRERARRVGREVVVYSDIQHQISTEYGEENEGA